MITSFIRNSKSQPVAIFPDIVSRNRKTSPPTVELSLSWLAAIVI